MNEPKTRLEALEELADEVEQLKRVILTEFEQSRLMTFIVTRIFRITKNDRT